MKTWIPIVSILLVTFLAWKVYSDKGISSKTANAGLVSTNDSSLRDTSGLKIYTSFDQIEPLFKKENDTLYVINFWATWCKPCLEEIPIMEQLVDSTKGTKTRVILVSMDMRNSLQRKLIPYIKQNNIEGEVVVLADPAANDWINRVSPQWTGSIPATLIYQNKKRWFKEGPFLSYKDLKHNLKNVTK
jgi:thiol-disulfide isomerase/thioredoxin